MSEADALERVDEPNTVSSLAADLRTFGLEVGDTVLVHSSLSALGWVCGDGPTVVDALQRVLTESGTLVMPTHTGQYGNPVHWSNPPVPDDWVDTIRETIPPFRPAVTPTRGMGAIAECFRSYPDVVRSRHPEFSFAAWGTNAEDIIADHSLEYGLGEGSPLARLYDHDAKILLLGTDHDTNTSLHLAEHRAAIATETVTNGAPLLEDGTRVWVEYEDIETSTDDFLEVGAAFDQRESATVQVGTDGAVGTGADGAVRVGTVGAAETRLITQRTLVDFAVGWFEANR